MNKVREYRHRRGLSQQALAKRACTSTSTLVFIELYDHLPRAGLRRLLAQALDVSEAELWPETGEAGKNSGH